MQHDKKCKNKNNITKVTVEQLSAERLNRALREKIEALEGKVSDLDEQAGKRSFKVQVSDDGFLHIDIRAKIPVKNVVRLMGAGGVGASIVAFVKAFLL